MTRTREMAQMALFMALVTVATMVVRIPTPQTNGYMNLGDSMVLLCGLFFGPLLGFVTGGIGSMLADILGGYAQWAPWTLAIKGVEAAIAALVFKALGTKLGQTLCRIIMDTLLLSALVALVYYTMQLAIVSLFSNSIGHFLELIDSNINSKQFAFYKSITLWPPALLIIKGIGSFLATLILIELRTYSNQSTIRLVSSFLLAVAWMVLGYFGAECIMYDPKAALVEVPANLIQAGGSLVLASLLYPLFERVIASRGRA